jgi:hypothetical protein
MIFPSLSGQQIDNQTLPSTYSELTEEGWVYVVPASTTTGRVS